MATPEASVVGQAVTLTAALTPPLTATLTGSVDFAIDGVEAGSATLAGNVATFAVARPLSIGTHILGAVWAGDSTYPAVTLTGSHVVVGIASGTVLTSSLNPSMVGQAVTLTATVTGAGSVLPTGAVTFKDAGTVLGAVPLTAAGSSAMASLTTNGLAAGPHGMVASYAGDGEYAGSSGSLTQVVQQLAAGVTLTSASNPALYGQTIGYTVTVGNGGSSPVPTGTVTLTGSRGENSTAVLSGGVATFRSGLEPAGSFTLIASYAGDGNFAAGGSARLTQVVLQAGTTTTLTAMPNPAYQYQTVTLGVQVAEDGGVSLPGGTVLLLDGGTTLATVTLVNGQASFATAGLAPGVHSLRAVYLGDPNHVASATSVLMETILASDFVLTATPPTLSLKTGHHITFEVTATSVGLFADTLTFSGGKLPAYVTLTPAPGQTQLVAGGQANVSVYLDTDAVPGYLSWGRGEGTGGALAALAGPFGLLLLGWRRRRLWALLGAVLVSVGLMAAGGCSSKYPGSTAPGSYLLEIQAVGAQSGIAHVVEVVLTVTP